MTSINTNPMANVASNALTRNERAMSTSMERLSTGLRINSAKDDAAGLAIAKKMGAQVVGLRQAARNANDAISMLQTLEGASKEITSMLTRMRELTVQAMNDTYTADDRANLGAEYSKLQDEIKRIIVDTQWNTKSLMGADNGDVSIQLGANSGQSVDITIMDWEGDVYDLVEDWDDTFTTAADYDDQLDALDDAIAAATTERSEYGAWISRMEYAADNLMNVALNTDASRGRIEDADYALETTELARTQIIAQAGTAMLAQANQAKQSVLALLK